MAWWRWLRRYTYDPETEKTRPKPVEAESSFTSGIDDVGWFGNLRLPVEDGLVYEQAVRAAREQLYAQNQADAPEGEKPEPVSNADAIVGLAESFLRNGQAALPGSERFQVLLHLETAVNQPDGPGILTYGTGPRLPEAVRRLLLCGCSVAPVWEAHGSPLSVGRAQRVLSRRMRRLVEHRDGHACRIPGCGRRLGLEVHHIVHWEDGGATDTANLVSLCRRHHRLHHQGLLGIDGNADPVGDLVVTDRWGHALDPAGSPIRPARGSTPIEAAEAAGIVPGDYTHPLGERLDHAWVTFNPNPGVHLDVSGNVPPPIPLRPPAPEPGIDEPGAPAAGAAPPAA